MLQLLEIAQESLDKIWYSICKHLLVISHRRMKRFAKFPEDRMEHVFSLIGDAIISFLQFKLGALDLWQEPFLSVFGYCVFH